MKCEDLTGRVFGRLMVVGNAGKRGRNIVWHCRCECGNTSVVQGGALENGSVRSCGCLQKELAAAKKHKHGMVDTRVYRIWSNMKNRCNNPNDHRYSDYGGRGIAICDEWNNDFCAFHDWSLKAGYNDSLTLERKDNDKGYTPDNCIWATRIVQMNNTRRNRYIRFNGEAHSVADWARITGIPYETLIARVKRGWTAERALMKAEGK